MSIRRWDPFDELTSLRASMERLFDDLFTTRRPGRALAPALWEPAGELFERAVGLPASVQADQAKATFRHGMLEVRIPKAERGRAKSIKVEVE